MSKPNRFLESLVHDIPLYPFSHTDDGRIVAELSRSRQENNEFQERSLAIQRSAVDRLAEIHKGSLLVPASDFQSSRTAQILGDVAYEMQNAYHAQERNAQKIDALSQATTEGFDEIHQDLTAIKGPDYPHHQLESVDNDDDDNRTLIS